MTTDILSFILILAVLLFGSVEIWSVSIILFMVYTLGLLWILKKEYSRNLRSLDEKLLVAIAAVFLFYAIVQITPLPPLLLKIVSPTAYSIHSFYSPGSDTIMSISLYPYKTVAETLRAFAFFITFFIALANCKDTDKLTRMMKVLTVFGFCVSMFAIVQKATWNGGIYWFRELTLGGTPFGPFVNRNHFAGFIGMIIPLGLGLALTRRAREDKILYGFITVIMTVALFFSMSRGGITGFFGGVALFSLLTLKSRMQAKKVWLIGLFLVIAATYIIYLGIDPIIERFYKTDITTEQRLTVWSATISACRDFWFTGSGMGTFINVFPLYSPSGIRNLYEHAHNDYLEFILETGTISVMMLVAFVSISLHSINKSMLHGKKELLLIALVSSAFTMAVHSFFDFNLHILSNMLLFSSVLGMAVGLSNSKEYRNAPGMQVDAVSPADHYSGSNAGDSK